MTTTEDLRRTLVENADLAPDPLGLIEAAREGAARVQRRRRLFAASGVAAVVVLALVATALVRPDIRTVPPAEKPPYRPPMHLTVSVAAGSPYRVLAEGSNGPYQFLMVRLRDIARGGAMVAIADPGVFDAAALLAGERITIGGHPAYYTPVQPFPDSFGPGPSGEPTTGLQKWPAAGWRDASGAWVILWEADREELIRVGENLRFGPPRAMRTAFLLGATPGLRYEFGKRSFIDDFGAEVGLVREGTPPRRPDLDKLSSEGLGNLEVTVRVDTYDDSGDRTETPEPVGGHAAWFVESLNPKELFNVNGRVLRYRTLVVQTAPTCFVKFSTTYADDHSREELLRIAQAARYADCTKPDTWFEIRVR